MRPSWPALTVGYYSLANTSFCSSRHAEEDPLDRELQATALAEIMAASTWPVIFLGYVVSKPHEPRRTSHPPTHSDRTNA